jgi:hypothetical protein
VLSITRTGEAGRPAAGGSPAPGITRSGDSARRAHHARLDLEDNLRAKEHLHDPPPARLGQPRGAASDPLTLAGAFLDAHQAVHPGVHVSHLDLHDGTLPAFGRLHAGAKMAVTRGGQPSPEQTGAWDAFGVDFHASYLNGGCASPGSPTSPRSASSPPS